MTIIYIAIFLSIYAFAILAPYTLNLIMLLKPDSIIYELSKNIKINNFELSDDVGDEHDPIQPITDILINSLLRYDAATSAFGVKVLNDSISMIFYAKNKDISNEKRAIKYYVDHLTTLGSIALRTNYKFINNISLVLCQLYSKESEFRDTISLYIIRAFGEIGELAAEEGFVGANRAASLSAKRLGELGKISVECYYGDYLEASLAATYSLGIIGEIASQRGTYKSNAVSLESVTSLEKIDASLATSKVLAIKPTLSVIRSLVRISNAEIENGSEHSISTAMKIVKIIGNIGKRTAESNQEPENKISLSAAESLKAIALISIKKGFGKPGQLTNCSIMHLEEIGIIDTNYQVTNKLSLYTVIESYLEDIGFKSLNQNFGKKNEAAFAATASIRKIALNCLSHDPEKDKTLIIESIDYFRIIGRESLSKNFGKNDHVSGEAIRSMEEILSTCNGINFSYKYRVIIDIISGLIEICLMSMREAYVNENEVAYFSVRVLINSALNAKSNDPHLFKKIMDSLIPVINMAKKMELNKLLVELQKLSDINKQSVHQQQSP